MPIYRYKAYPPQGDRREIVEAQAEAANESELIDQLKKKRLVPIEITEEKETQLSDLSLKNTDRVLFIRQLATLLGSHLPIDQALFHLRDQAETLSIKKICIALYQQIEQGSALSVALRSFPRIFPRFYCETVSAGEVSGKLSVVLEQLADYSETQEALRSKVMQAITYPMTVISVALFILTFLLYYVVPKIVGVFSQTGQALPFLTQILLQISGFVQSYGLGIFLAGIALFWMHKRAMHHSEYRRKNEIFWSKVPGIGSLMQLFSTTIFFKTLDILLRSGVPLIESLESATRVVEQIRLQEALAVAQKNIKEGMTVYKAFQQSGLFTPMALCLIASGENGGDLVPMVHRVAEVQQNMFSDSIKKSLTLLEPIMILLMGMMILFIVLAVLLPIFSMDVQTPS